MSIKKIFAAAAAAVLTVAAPITGMLPDPLSVTVSAAEYKENDIFTAELDKNGNLTGEYGAYESPTSYTLRYVCTVKPDGTLKLGFEFRVKKEDIDYDPDKTYLFAAFFGKTIAIPSEINGYTVTEIGECAYLGCTKLIIPDSVTDIGEGAFADDPFLEEIVFDKNSQLKYIGKWSFEECRSLRTLNIPASVETIDYGAFLNVDEDYGKGTFINAELEEAEYDFSDKYSLTTVTFAEGSKLKEIGEAAFQNQKALTFINLPDSLEKIEYGAFMGCTSLTEIVIPSNVNEIGIAAFSAAPNEGKMSLSRIEVAADNESFKSVDGIIFSKDGKKIIAYPPARSEDKFEIPAGVCEMDNGSFQFSSFMSVTLPEGITDIPDNAFSYCTALKEVKLPSTLKTIGKWGFEACAFTSIDIPESVTSIDPQAFESSQLKNINGAAGSYAETFAKENGYSFNGISGESSADSSESSGGPDKDSPDTGVADVAPIMGIALFAGAALVVLCKKRK